LGRGVESFDRRTVQDIVKQAAAREYKFQSFIQAIVHSAPFQQRGRDLKAEAPATGTPAGKTEGVTRK